MHFDAEGHIEITPPEVHALARSERRQLIHSVLIPGTPAAIPTHLHHIELLEYFANTMGIHPQCLFFKGSTKLAFSIAPRPEKVWMKYGPESDLDLAIVDSHFFETVAHEVGQWERDPINRSNLFRNHRLIEAKKNRAYHSGNYKCYRFFDLPDIECMRKLGDCMRQAPVAGCCGVPRTMEAFVFKDWWGVEDRFDHDLHCLCSGVERGVLAAPPPEAFPHEESVLSADN
jgi:hypothetical protein